MSNLPAATTNHSLAEPYDRAFYAMEMAAKTSLEINERTLIIENLCYRTPPIPGEKLDLDPLMFELSKDGDRLRGEVRKERALILAQRKAIAGFLRDAQMYLATATAQREEEIESDDSLDPMTKMVKQAARRGLHKRDMAELSEIEAGVPG